MKNIYAILLITGIMTACTVLDKDQQLVEVNIPILKYGEQEKPPRKKSQRQQNFCCLCTGKYVY